MSLGPVAPVLAEKLGVPVLFLNDCVGPDIESAVNQLTDGQIALLESLRFHKGETDNDPDFARQLSNLAEVFVNDAFGTAHRAHASTFGVAELLPCLTVGLLIEKELEYLGEKTATPNRPFTVILGGAKVGDKIMVIDKLLEKADNVIIGGAMAYTFAMALGKKVSDSLCEPDKTDLALNALSKARDGRQFFIAVDDACDRCTRLWCFKKLSQAQIVRRRYS